MGNINRRDSTSLSMRPIQHAVARNLLGCVKTFHHLGAELSGTVHWAVSGKAHGTLKELLRLGVKGGVRPGEWEGCSPLMLASAVNDAYCLRILLDDALAKSPRHLSQAVCLVQAGKFKAHALHHAADAAADMCVELLLQHGANRKAKNGKGETGAVVARRRLALAEKGPSIDTRSAAQRCCDMLEGTTPVRRPRTARALPARPL